MTTLFRLRTAATVGAFVLAVSAAGAPGFAQAPQPSAADEPSLDRIDPGAARKPPSSDRAVRPALPEDPKAELDPLFEKLAKAPSKMAAHPLEQRILSIITRSGSGTVDLLMGWADEAINAKNYPEALDLLDEAVALKPDFAEAYNKRATVYYMLDDYTRSMGDIRRTLALQPRHFGALTGLGAILAELDEPERAREIYRQALEIDPHLETVQEALKKLDETAAGRGI